MLGTVAYGQTTKPAVLAVRIIASEEPAKKYRGREAEKWVADLSDASATTRFNALVALSEIGTHTDVANVVRALHKAIADEDFDNQRIAACLLSELSDDPSALPVLLRSLDQTYEWWPQIRICDGLARYGSLAEPALDSLNARLKTIESAGIAIDPSSDRGQCYETIKRTISAITREQKEKAAIQAKAAEETKAAALRSLEGSPTFKDALADMNAKEKRLNELRRSGAPQDRIDASASYLKAKKKVDDMRSAVAAP